MLLNVPSEVVRSIPNIRNINTFKYQSRQCGSFLQPLTTYLKGLNVSLIKQKYVKQDIHLDQNV